MSRRIYEVEYGTAAANKAAGIIEAFHRSLIQGTILPTLDNFRAIAEVVPMTTRALIQAIVLRSEFKD